jgi:perosamine synthetase
MQSVASERAWSRTRSNFIDYSSLAAFGGTPAVPSGRVVPWPAANETHLRSLAAVVKSGKYHRVNHPIVQEFEKKFSEWTGWWNVRAVATGTAAIHVALDQFKTRGRTVVAAALNWPGAVGPIHFCGLEPTFVDVSLEDTVLDQEAAKAALDSDASAILVTHLFGNPAFVPELRSQVRHFSGAAIIDDAAQSIALVRSIGPGLPLDSDAVIVSANGAKHLGAGELGLICTRDQELVEHVDRVSLTSSARNGERVFSPMTEGYNYRPNVFSAAVALGRIGELGDQLVCRRKNAAALWNKIMHLDGLRPLFRPSEPSNSFLNLPFRIDPEQMGLPQRPETRDFIVGLLKAEGVPVSVWLTKPVFEYLPHWRGRWSAADFPNTQRILDTMFHLTEIAPPNDEETMALYADAFEKIWAMLPYLGDRVADASRAR